MQQNYNYRLSLQNEPDNIDDAIKYHQNRIDELQNIRSYGFTSINLFKRYKLYKTEVERIESFVNCTKQQPQNNNSSISEKTNLKYCDDENFLKRNFEYGKRCIEYAIEHDLHIPERVLDESLILKSFIINIHQHYNDLLLHNNTSHNVVLVDVTNINWLTDISIDSTTPLVTKKFE